MRTLVLVLALLAVAVVAPLAQVSAPPAQVAASMKLDESDALAIQVVQIAGQRANDGCQGLDAVKQYQTLLTQARARFAKKYPTFDVDFAKGTLVPKAAAAPAAAK